MFRFKLVQRSRFIFKPQSFRYLLRFPSSQQLPPEHNGCEELSGFISLLVISDVGAETFKWEFCRHSRVYGTTTSVTINPKQNKKRLTICNAFNQLTIPPFTCFRQFQRAQEKLMKAGNLRLDLLILEVPRNWKFLSCDLSSCFNCEGLFFDSSLRIKINFFYSRVERDS